MAAIANGTAMNGNSDEEYQSGKKNDKSRGETLVVVDPREEAVKSRLPSVRTKGRNTL